MSGRGRGRGRGGAALPPSIANRPQFGPPQPPPVSRTEPSPTFPSISLPTPSDPSTPDDLDAIKYADLLGSYMKGSPYFLVQAPNTNKIDRYSDKYTAHLRDQDRKGKILAIATDLAFFPEELHTMYDPEKARKWSSVPQAKPNNLSFGDALAKLKDLESKEASGELAGGEKDSEEDEDGDEVVYDEDEFEDETDYNFSYFDNGEDTGDFEDRDEGPVY